MANPRPHRPRKAGSTVHLAALQCSLSDQVDINVQRISELAHLAAARGAQIILPPELFEGFYFCQEQKARHFRRARPAHGHPTIEHFRRLAKKLQVVIPVSFFERAGTAHYNSIAIIDADGSVLGIYRKSHIPDGPGYQEKFYFRPGDTGFAVWPTRFGTIGVGICWDQWFPECARAMVLLGAEVLLYPTAIGSEPEEPDLDTKAIWQRAMIGHAVSNVIPVVAANRTGREREQTFYGSSFVSDHRGELLAELGRTETGVASAQIDLDRVREDRAAFGFFRDRRPELYASLAEFPLSEREGSARRRRASTARASPGLSGRSPKRASR